jgi:hypothetical protein
LDNLNEVTPWICKEGDSKTHRGDIMRLANNRHAAALQFVDCIVDAIDTKSRGDSGIQKFRWTGCRETISGQGTASSDRHLRCRFQKGRCPKSAWGKLACGQCRPNPEFPQDRLATTQKPLLDHRQLSQEIKALADGTLGYLIEWRIRRFRLTGEQKVPARVWFQSADDYLKAVGKSREVELFRKSGTHSVGMPGVA